METRKDTQSISLKAFSERIRLPEQSTDAELPINPDAVLDDDFSGTPSFIFSPLLRLPPVFGSAYVGETFSCTLCANNELPQGTDRRVTSVSISAEIQAPTQIVALDLDPANEEYQTELGPGESLQKTIRFDLKEEGNHVLAVSVKYTETPSTNEGMSEGRIRTFRKLYQFVAVPCLSVRTKVSDFPLRGSHDVKRSYATPLSLALEAQLENMADGPITLEKVAFSPKPSFDAISINWDSASLGPETMDCPFLLPRDVTQAAFLLKQKSNAKEETTKDGRVILGQLMIRWRASMGDPGFLTTGWLTTRKRP